MTDYQPQRAVSVTGLVVLIIHPRHPPSSSTCDHSLPRHPIITSMTVLFKCDRAS